jgi:hypothetical protein
MVLNTQKELMRVQKIKGFQPAPVQNFSYIDISFKIYLGPKTFTGNYIIDENGTGTVFSIKIINELFTYFVHIKMNSFLS